MNRILFESNEIKDGLVSFGGVRAEHVLTILHGEVGQILKTGEIGGRIGTSEILAIESDRITVRTHHESESLKPWVDLILAPPRPRVMKRLLPQLATLGVGRIILVGAKKVEKDFWGATLLKEENYRPLLIDGLMQAGTSILPEIAVVRNFRRWVKDEMDAAFPTRNRVVAHPYGGAALSPTVQPVDGRLLLAVGPEGGWTDEEVESLEAKGFRRQSLGPRILRTDTALIALLARFMDVNERT